MAEVQNVMEPGEVTEMVFEPTRALRYVELFMVGPEWIYVYNSIGLSEGPPELWDALDEQGAAAQLGVERVLKNGPHWWMSDTATLRFGVDEITVGGIGFRYASARLPAFIAQSGKIEPGRYHVNEANKAGVLTYAAGEPVYELVSPDGDAFVLQSTNIEPKELATLGERLSPAEGWQFRTRTLDEELTVTMTGKVKVVADDFMNFYNLPEQAGAAAAPSEGTDKPLDVVVAVYPGPDSAGNDFDAFRALADGGTVRTDGALLVTRDAQGAVQTREAAGPDGAKAFGGRFVKGRVIKAIAGALDEKLPPGAAAIVAVYDHPHAVDVDQALGGAMVKSVGHIDKASPKQLKAGLEEAQTGL